MTNKLEQFICTTEATTPTEVVKLDQTNFAPTIHELTLLVAALTEFGKLILPLFPNNDQKKTESKSQIKTRNKS